MRIQTEVLKIIERLVVAMISRRTSSFPQEDVVFPRQLNGETLASSSSHRKVSQINRVRGYGID